MRLSQLWKKTSSDCKLVDSYIAGNHRYIQAAKVPIYFWPDGSVCVPVTIWLVTQAKNYLSDENTKGKSNNPPVTHASLISSFVRYVHLTRKKNFYLIDDEDVKSFREYLRSEINNRTESKKREDSQVAKIMRKSLNFIVWYQKYLLPESNLIGEELNNKITITYKTQKVKKISITYINHRHIPEKSTPQKIKPIANVDIDNFYQHLNSKYKDNKFLRKRNRAILSLLEATGVRCSELVRLSVDDILNAIKTGVLIFYTSKSNLKQRQIPIEKEWLLPILNYINGERKRKIENYKIKNPSFDSNALLINDNDCRRMTSARITKLFSEWRLGLGITQKAAAHMFRHRFITLQVLQRINGYNRSTLPIGLKESLLVRVAELSGHSDPESLLVYIDLAFEEMKIWDEPEAAIKLRSKSEALLTAIKQIKVEINEGCLSTETAIDLISELLSGILE
jgi:integrase